MRFARLLASVLATATTVVALHCAPVQSQSKQIDGEAAVKGGPPVLESVRPDSVLLPFGGIAEVTLTGTSFTPGQPGKNIVHFNGAVFPNVAASPDGRRIVFNIPDVISYGGAAPPSNLVPGSYKLSVETSSGTSNVATVRVYR